MFHLCESYFHSVIGIIRKELNSILAKDCGKNKYVYVINIIQLSYIVRENHMYRCMRSLNVKALENLIRLVLKLIHKIKVPVRPDRNNQRWGRHVNSSNPLRFRLDGRNWSKVTCIRGRLRTVEL